MIPLRLVEDRKTAGAAGVGRSATRRAGDRRSGSELLISGSLQRVSLGECLPGWHAGNSDGRARSCGHGVRGRIPISLAQRRAAMIVAAPS